MTEGADAPLRRRIEGRIDEERASSLLGGRDSRGNSGGAPVAANFLSAGEEKKRGSVRWNSAMASSWLPSVRWCSGHGRESLHVPAPAGGRAAVVVQNGVERGRVQGRWRAAKYADVGRAGVIRQREPRRNGMVTRMVACAWTRVVPTPSSSSASWIKNLSSGSALSMIRCTSDKLKVPVSFLWHVRHVRPVAAECLLVEELLPVELDAKLFLATPFESGTLLLLSASAIVTPKAAS